VDLCQQCEALGVHDTQLDGAVQDAHNPKACVITLLLDALTVQATRKAEEAGAAVPAEAEADAEAGAGLVEEADDDD
jgi:hypothetical protein